MTFTPLLRSYAFRGAGSLGPGSATRLTTRCNRLFCSASATGDAQVLVDCSKVHVKADAYGGAGAFAACDIAAGQVVEKGIVRVLTNVDGNENPFVFTWSDQVPNKTWATGSGCSTFYNTASESESNTHMERNYQDCSFVITATKDITKGEELLHVYKSKGWRTCFQSLE